jgi:general nucleoside transport system permease protein
MKATTKHDPLFRIVKKNNTTWKTGLVNGLIAFGVAVVITILYLWAVSSKNPFIAFKYLIEGTFQVTSTGLSMIRLWSAIQEIVILLAIALALTPAYKMKFWNIGAQGQLLMGGLVTAVLMIYLHGVASSGVIIALAIVCSMLAGALWGWIPAYFKAKFNTNETLFTLMMNYIAVLIVTLCYNIWKGSASSMRNINLSDQVGWLPYLGNQAALLPMILVLILVALMTVYLRYTKHGYEISVVGDSIQTARYTGIAVRHVIRRTMALSGALCGIVGFFYVSNFSHIISATTGGSYGFTAIIVCWLSHFNPIAMVGYSSLIIFLNKGARNLSNVNYSSNINEYSAEAIVFIIILAIMLSEFFTNYKIVTQLDPHKRTNELTAGLSDPSSKEAC